MVNPTLVAVAVDLEEDRTSAAVLKAVLRAVLNLVEKLVELNPVEKLAEPNLVYNG